MAVEAGLSVYVVGGQGVRLFVVVVSCGVLDVFLLGGFLSRHHLIISSPSSPSSSLPLPLPLS